MNDKEVGEHGYCEVYVIKNRCNAFAQNLGDFYKIIDNFAE